jgi:predicted RNA binding protein YcfA (HicA-like mRNA interferase family)
VAARLQSLSGRDVIRILDGFGFEAVATRGSHAKLRRITASGERQIITVPLHKELAPGTLHAIYRQALKFIAAEQLRTHFFHE